MTEEELLARAEKVYHLALRLCGDPTDAEDLAQDALVRALKARESFRGESAVETWLYRITVNTWKNRVRSETRRGGGKTASIEAFTGEDHEGEAPFPSNDPPPGAGLEAEERDSAVQKALLELDDDSRAVVLLRDLEGLAYDEIAQSLGVPEGTVKSRLSRARQELKEKLKKFVQS